MTANPKADPTTAQHASCAAQTPNIQLRIMIKTLSTASRLGNGCRHVKTWLVAHDIQPHLVHHRWHSSKDAWDHVQSGLAGASRRPQSNGGAAELALRLFRQNWTSDCKAHGVCYILTGRHSGRNAAGSTSPRSPWGRLALPRPNSSPDPSPPGTNRHITMLSRSSSSEMKSSSIKKPKSSNLKETKL